MSPPTKRPLAEQLRRERSKLIASLMEREPTLTRKLVEVDEALQSIRPDLDEAEFAQHRTGLDAVLAYLDLVHVFSFTSTIIDSVVAGGYAPNDANRRANLRDTIFYHTNKSGRLVRRASDGAIGKPEWADDVPSENT